MASEGNKQADNGGSDLTQDPQFGTLLTHPSHRQPVRGHNVIDTKL